MEPGVKDRDFMYKLIIGQLYHDGHTQLAIDLSNSIELSPSSPSDKLFRLVSAAQLVEDEADEEEKGTDMQMPPNQVAESIDNLPIDEESRDYFPFLALPTELQEHVFSYLSIKDRMRARVTNSLVEVEAKSKYHVERLFIHESDIRDPSCSWLRKINPSAQFIVFVEGRSESSDCIRRIAHNASIGHLWILLSGSSEFHREVYNLIKEFDIGHLRLFFENDHLEREMMVDSFVLDLTRSCKDLELDSRCGTPETLHEVYKILLDGLTKLRHFTYNFTTKDKCIAFLRLIGITYRRGRFFSNRNIEVFKQKRDYYYSDQKGYHIFDGSLELIIEHPIFLLEEGENGHFHLIRHETPESLEKAKKKGRMKRVEIGPE